ncbi:MAG: hypothetical protein ACPGWR_11510, partial [Ardenticatenaceae bacterium]
KSRPLRPFGFRARIFFFASNYKITLRLALKPKICVNQLNQHRTPACGIICVPFFPPERSDLPQIPLELGKS